MRDDRGLRAEVGGAELDELTGVPGLARFHASLRGEAQAVGTCPRCGWERSQVAGTSMVGCGLCYTVFEGAIIQARLARPNGKASE